MKKINFQTAVLDDLVQVVKIKSGRTLNIFAEWFNFHYSLSEKEENFLLALIDYHKDYVASYSEEDLKMYFISPIINEIRFHTETRRGFYEKTLKAIINGVEFSGKTDFMVAMGIKIPVKPYFFIQEFKQTKHSVDVEDQLLAEMLVAIELNKTNRMRGAYILGRYWHFVILEKNVDDSYQYYISDSCDSLNFNGLKQIFICLQAVKLVFCND